MVVAVCIMNWKLHIDDISLHSWLFLYVFTAHECDFVDNKIACSCRKGYKVDDDDDKNCVDVDECRESNGG